MGQNGNSENEPTKEMPDKQTPAEELPQQEPPKREPKPITISDLEYEQLKKELSENKDKYLRAIAESENLRKRLHKERHDMTQMAVQSVVVDFLDPIDHMEKALSFTDGMSEDVRNWAIGFKMILNQFKDVLAANDVHPFKSVGMPFDHNNHEAVEMVETTDQSPGMVVEESLRGYKMGSKTIRPARVKVSKAPTPSKKEE